MNSFDIFAVFRNKSYRKCCGVLAGCCAAMLLMFVPLVLLIGDKEMEDFLTLDWVVFWAFAVIELALIFVIFVYCVKVIRIGIRNANEITSSYSENFRLAGLQEGEYDYVWLNYKGVKRAVILQQSGVFSVSIEKFNTQEKPWVPIADEQFSSLEELKRALYYDFNFCCDENSDIDEFGNTTFKC